MRVNNRRYISGFTLAEVAVSVMVAALLLSLMIPTAMRMVDKAKDDKALTDLEEIQERITTFYRANYRYPLSLMEIYVTAPIDPWGNPYQYLNIADAPNQGKGEGEGIGEGGSYKGAQVQKPDPHQYGLRPVQHGHRRQERAAPDGHIQSG